MLSLEPVGADDFDAMHELRDRAMRESLERLGRYDPERLRQRLLDGFAPEHMRHVCRSGERIGFLTLEPRGTGLYLRHLYVAPGAQGQGAGAWAIAWIKSHGSDVTLNALKLSDSNRFYLRHGFEVVGESEFDIEYRWSTAGRLDAMRRFVIP